MYAKRKYSSRRKRLARSYITNRRAIRKARKSNFARAVKKLINAETESKQAFLTSGNTLTMFNSGLNSSGDMLQVIPNIAQGVGQGQRIGDKIKAQSCSVKGHLRIIPNDLQDIYALPQVYVRLMMVSLKYRSNYTDATGGGLSSLLKKGQSVSAWSGVFSDMNAPINSDMYTLHAERKFYLNQSAIVTAGTSAPSATVAINTANTVKFFNLKYRCKNKILRYDSTLTSGLQPTNAGPFLLVGYCYLDGTSPDTISTNLGMEYITDFRYEDV